MGDDELTGRTSEFIDRKGKTENRIHQPKYLLSCIKELQDDNSMFVECHLTLPIDNSEYLPSSIAKFHELI